MNRRPRGCVHDLNAEAERMRPVVEAALHWRDNDLPFDKGHRALVEAVDSYRRAAISEPDHA